MLVERWIFQVLPIGGQNDGNIRDCHEFREYVERHQVYEAGISISKAMMHMFGQILFQQNWFSHIYRFNPRCCGRQQLLISLLNNTNGPLSNNPTGNHMVIEISSNINPVLSSARLANHKSFHFQEFNIEDE